MSDEREKGDPGQVLDVLRNVLTQHLDSDDELPEYRVQSAVFIGHSGRLMSNNAVIDGHDVIAGLRLTMRSGDEYDLTLN